MLKFKYKDKNIKLLYDFEIGRTNKPVLCSRNNPMCSDDYIKEICPNSVFINSIKELFEQLDKLNISYVFLSADLFQKFVYSWLDNFVDVKSWYDDYIQSLKEVDDSTYPEDYNELESIFRVLQHSLIMDLKNNDLNPEYYFDLLPEISICLKYYIEKGMYENVIIPEVERNKKVYSSYLKIWKDAIFISSFNNFNSNRDIIYITQPFSLDQIQTNHKYLENLLYNPATDLRALLNVGNN